MNEKHLVTKPAVVFGGFTIVSRILGLLRDMLAASIIGAGVFWDAFVVALTFPNLFRRILGEGALGAAFVPIFSEYLHRDGKHKAWQIANIVVTLLTSVLIILSIVTIFLLTIGRIYLPLSNRIDLVFKLSQIMFPYVIFICLVGLFLGILNTFHKLTIPAIAPIVFNVVLIIGILLVKGIQSELKIILLAFIVLIGGVVELLIHFPALKKVGMKFKIDFNWRHPAIKQILFLMGPMILGFGVTQINIVVDRILALCLGPGSASILYYGNRLVQLPQGVFGVALAVASLSVMSKQAARLDIKAMKETLNYSLRMVFFMGLPASIGLIVLRHPIVSIIFERGDFTHEAAVACSRVLLCYSLGLFAFLGLKIATQCFYALKDSKTPMKIAAAMVILNLVLNLSLMFILREAGLALATSLCSFANMAILFLLLSKKINGMDFNSLLISVKRNGISALVMGVICWIIVLIIGGVGRNVFALCGVIIAGLISYIITSLLLGAPEFKELVLNIRYGRSKK